MKRLRLGFVFAVGLLILTTASVYAAWWQLANTGCGQYMVVNSLCMTEDANAGGDEMFVVQGDTANTNLRNIGRTLGDRHCTANIINSETWNDCISYVRFNIGAGHTGCLYTNADATGVILKLTGPWNGAANLSYGNDQGSMFNIHTGSSC